MSASPAPGTQTTLSALAVFLERRTLVMLALGFSAGLPFLLIFDTLSAWLRDKGLSLEVIGFFSLATLVYSFKFLWAPLVDRASIPFLTNWLGHRRSWMLLAQCFIMLGLFLVAGSDPQVNLSNMAMFAVCVGFASATQDIAIDAWRIEATDISKQGAMASAYQWGYRLAIIVAGAAPLLIAQAYNWNLSYAIMALLMLIGMVAVLCAPREKAHTVRSIVMEDTGRTTPFEYVEWVVRFGLLLLGALLMGSGLAANATLLAQILSSLGLVDAAKSILEIWAAKGAIWIQFVTALLGFGVIGLCITPLPHLRTRPGIFLSAALGDPLRNFFARYKNLAGLILALICTYRLSDFVLTIMNPFYLDLGFTLGEVAEVRKVFGVIASMAGVFLGGFAVAHLGLMRALVIGAFGGPLSNLIFIYLAMQGHSVGALFIAIGVDNVSSGFAGTCLIAYMSSLTAEGFTATQYAFFSSLYALPGRLIASQSGRLVEGAAVNADQGGMFAVLTPLFATLPPESFAASMEKSGVAREALGAGYTVFFLYSAIIGVFSIGLAFVLFRRQRVTQASPIAS